jgi:bla regulator protein blaR1
MISELANHVWQSTLFAVAVGLLTLMCRKNHASVRYGLWLSASVKFFVPFTLLMALGDRLEWAAKAPQITASAVSAGFARMSRPFVEDPALGALLVPEAPRGVGWVALAVLAMWVSGCIAVTVMRFRMWRRIRTAVRASVPWAVRSLPVPADVHVRSTPGVMEPGVVGVWRPVILVPSGIEDDLTPQQLAAVLLHERCHIQRRDNLTAAVHMLAEAVFWFHPLVWWIGSRLVDERERACDEDVLRTSGEPLAYAEGIVNVCRRCVESPLACVSGVSGANVKNRIREILANRTIAKLSVTQKLVLAAAGAIAVVAPLVAQSVPRPSVGELRFEVASIKRNNGDARQMIVLQRFVPVGGFEGINVTAESVIRLAYGLQDFQVVGGPKWISTDRFDIQVRGPQGATASEAPRRLQSLLADRFALKAHRETRTLPIFALVLARADKSLGPRLRRSKSDPEKLEEQEAKAMRENPATYSPPQCGLTAGRRLGSCSSTLATMASRFPMYVGRMVVDRTGLAGGYEYDLRFGDALIPGAGPGGGFPFAIQPPDPDAPSLFTALEEQLGLKLVPQTGPVEVLVIDNVEPPKPN